MGFYYKFKMDQERKVNSRSSILNMKDEQQKMNLGQDSID